MIIVVSFRLTECCFGQNVHSSSGSFQPVGTVMAAATTAITTAKHAYNLFVAAVFSLYVKIGHRVYMYLYMSLCLLIGVIHTKTHIHVAFSWQVKMKESNYV